MLQVFKDPSCKASHLSARKRRNCPSPSLYLTHLLDLIGEGGAEGSDGGDSGGSQVGGESGSEGGDDGCGEGAGLQILGLKTNFANQLQF